MSLFQLHSKPALIGVVHLPPLPGAPTASTTLKEVIAHAVNDATALIRGGADGLIIENFGDAPFQSGTVEPTTIAMMTRIGVEIKKVTEQRSIGINVLRNDANGALAVASACEAAFIRVNVHTGVMATDQGLITGQARDTLLQKNRYGLSTKIAADVHVKHATPLANESFTQAAKDSWYRGHADALIVTGSGTGEPVNAEQLQDIARNIPNAPIWIGSGLTPETLPNFTGRFHVAIVGTWLHKDGEIHKPIDIERVQIMRQLLSE